MTPSNDAPRTHQCQSWCVQHDADGSGGLYHLSVPVVAEHGTMSRTMMRTDRTGAIIETPALLLYPPGQQVPAAPQD